MEVIEATSEHANDVAVLFDLYRQFYECEPDLPLATRYIKERIENNESCIFLAKVEQATIGFVQLYPTFCSVQAIKIYVLYDLYVDASGRNNGVGALLMNKAKDYAIANGAARVDLQTAASNKPGQHLYEKLGYAREAEEYYTYSLQL